MSWVAGEPGPATSRWVIRSPVETPAAARLLCLPYAGGSAGIYRSWFKRLPPVLEVGAIQLPGRGTRIDEPPFTRLRSLTHTLAQVVAPWLDRPYAIFGHSMGALLAYELALQLRQDHASAPAQLIVSGHRAPHLPDPDPPIHDLDEPSFLEALQRLSGLPAEILEDAELRALVMPALRADFELCETYVAAPAPPLNCPLLVLGGREDPKVEQGDLWAWRPYTTATFDVQMVEGGHFFLQTLRSQTLDMVARALAPAVGSLTRASVG